VKVNLRKIRYLFGVTTTTTKQILVIGMLDSIHLARWLEQFKDEGYEFLVFPSKKYRKLHPDLKVLIGAKFKSSFLLANHRLPKSISGYLDYISNRIVTTLFRSDFRVKQLQRIINTHQFEYIHACEMQGAGYLLDSVDSDSLANTRTILTNWGSDIYFFQQFPEHIKKLKSVLAKANYYSAECERDYKLATEFGFAGKFLPCIPNAGGFQVDLKEIESVPTSRRRQVLIKGYGGLFGRAELAISLIPEISTRFPDLTFHVYSATKDTIAIIEEQPLEIQGKIRITTNDNKLSHEEMLKEFLRSRIYIGCSISDGISTSFIEALICGTFPIQTDTSCANEWVNKGAMASIVPLNSDSVMDAVFVALENDQLVDDSAMKNQVIAQRYLSKEVVRKVALDFYR
jgi:glycosyltransferase involved in cell wall biosynthesis